MKIFSSRLFILGCGVLLASLVSMNCGAPSKVVTEPELPPEPSKPGLILKPYHYDMMDEMLKSFENADEIILGTYTGKSANKELGLAYFFDGFQSFDKKTMTWTPVKEIVLSLYLKGLKPEIIAKNEFRILPKIDKTGICWDVVDQERYFYLVQGQKNLMFIKISIPKNSDDLNRILIDTYPATRSCKTKDLFDLMLRRRAKSSLQKK